MRNFYCLLSVLFFLFLIGCSTEVDTTQSSPNKVPVINVVNDLHIGTIDQPIDHQFGRPITIRSDEDGTIYVADEQSFTIKVFSEDGEYLRSLGGRGRGPTEFQNIRYMELTDNNNLAVLDRGNLRFKILDRDGGEVATYPYQMANQFYPQAVTYLDNRLFTLFFNSSSSIETPLYQRDIFHVYSRDYQTSLESFITFEQMGIDDQFVMMTTPFYPGSYHLSGDESMLYFSPGTYTGDIHRFKKADDGTWQADGMLEGMKPSVAPIERYDTDEEYQTAIDAGIPRAVSFTYRGENTLGRQLSVDAGIYRLKNGKIIHFYSKLDKSYRTTGDSENHPMDLYAQIFNEAGERIHHSFLFTYSEPFGNNFEKRVNWKDEQDRFYMVDYPEEVPVVRRFSLDLTGL